MHMPSVETLQYAEPDKTVQNGVHGGGGGGVGGGSGSNSDDVLTTPQSEQSVPRSQTANAAPGPPSSHTASEEKMQSFWHFSSPAKARRAATLAMATSVSEAVACVLTKSTPPSALPHVDVATA
jgi:hypothetical protein